MDRMIWEKAVVQGVGVIHLVIALENSACELFLLDSLARRNSPFGFEVKRGF